MTDWKHNNKEVKSLVNMPQDTYGFVYQISIELDGTKYFYIGQKKLISRRKRKFTKKEIATMPNKRAKKWEFVEKEMPWQSYLGSNKKLLDLIKTHGEKKLKLKKEILEYCFCALELKYREAAAIICSKSLESEQYFNDGVSLRQYGKLKFLK